MYSKYKNIKFLKKKQIQCSECLNFLMYETNYLLLGKQFLGHLE